MPFSHSKLLDFAELKDDIWRYVLHDRRLYVMHDGRFALALSVIERRYFSHGAYCLAPLLSLVLPI